MSHAVQTQLQCMLAKLHLRAPLDEADRAAVLGLPFRQQTFEPHRYIAREGAPSQHCVLLVDGYVMRSKVTGEGARQILSFHIPGDFCDLEAALLNVADHNLQALTRCEVAMFEPAILRRLIIERPQVGMALWIDTLVDASIFREWILNVGRRSAREKLAHVLCEFARRLEVAGLASTAGYKLPMTQEQLGDATGLTTVHVNRTLKQLEAEGLVIRNRKFVAIPDWDRLRQVADFSELYLHLDQVQAA